MYKNIGKKIKGFSIALAWIVITVSCLIGFYRLYTEEIDYKNIMITVLIIATGTLAAVVLSWFIYAFGVIAEKAESTDNSLRNIEDTVFEIKNKISLGGYPQNPDQSSQGNNIPLKSFKLPETRDELFESQLRKLKKDYEMSRITFDEYEEGKAKLEEKYK